MRTSIQIGEVCAWAYRVPLAKPVRTSFGEMTDRPMVLVRVSDTEGHEGWGEVWCNFPSVAAEHRAQLVERVLAPSLSQREFASPEHLHAALVSDTEVLVLQCGEPGPFAAAIAGVDAAAWDLVSRRAGMPLWRALGGESGCVPVYASGLGPDEPERSIAPLQQEGHTRFKLKVGFGEERDRHNLESMRALLPDADLMLDANQAWTLTEALEALDWLTPFEPTWLEEPLRADRPDSEWRKLRARTSIPLAAGENLVDEASFSRTLASGYLGVVQPDVAKRGGLSGCRALARRISASGARFCPHYLGGGVGLRASAHLLAAVGGGGWLEVDANPNPLRSIPCGEAWSIEHGMLDLGDASGTFDLSTLDDILGWRVARP